MTELPLLQRYVDSGHVDASDPERPVALATCQQCGTASRYPLWLERDSGPALVLSPLRWVLNGDLCEQCAQLAEAELVKRGLEVRVRESGIPKALAAEVSWESLITDAKTPDDRVKRERAIALARAWAESPAPGATGVWLHGPAGSGKTRLAATAALAKLQHVPVRWVSVAVLIMQLDGAWNDDDRKIALKVLTDPGVVVLDDLDKVTPSDRVRHALYTALERREQSKVGICVTSNEPPSKVGELFSSPLMSRLISMATPLAYPGPDRRLTLASSE